MTPSTHSPIKLIAIDMDGTLLNHQHRISERNRAALQAAIRQGVRIVLATGRARSAYTIGVMEELGLDTPGIFLQGLAVHNADGSLRFQHPFDPVLARPVIEYAEAKGYAVMIYAGSRVLTGSLTDLTTHLNRYHEPEAEAVGSLLHILDSTPFHKVVFVHDPATIADLRAEIEALVQDSASVVQTLPESFEIIPKGVSKGAALRHLMEAYHLSRQNLMAIGDGENDVEMIEFAGLGIAMANAMPRAKAAADHITASNQEDGVALAIERFVLQPG